MNSCGFIIPINVALKFPSHILTRLPLYPNIMDIDDTCNDCIPKNMKFLRFIMDINILR